MSQKMNIYLNWHVKDNILWTYGIAHQFIVFYNMIN